MRGMVVEMRRNVFYNGYVTLTINYGVNQPQDYINIPADEARNWHLGDTALVAVNNVAP